MADYFNNARDMVKQTQEICDEYGLVARSRRSKTCGTFDEVYAVDGEWTLDNGMTVKVQLQYVIYDICKWRYLLFAWDEDASTWRGGGFKMADDGAAIGVQYFDTFQEAVENAWDMAEILAGSILSQYGADDSEYADEADDVDE